jgi:transcriptional regulator with XRE-family HTH domain
MDLRRLVGRNVRRFRREKGWTQEALAVFAGVSQQSISDLENGKSNPTIMTLRELAQGLGVRPMDLLDENPKS